MYPTDYLYTEEHEWLHVEEDVCTIGITEFAQKELGDVVYVDLPDVGRSFDAGDEIGSLESVKAVAEYYTPVAGEVVEVNENLEKNPEQVNEDPHGDGWLVKLRLTSDEGLSELMSAADYRLFVAGDEGED